MSARIIAVVVTSTLLTAPASAQSWEAIRNVLGVTLVGAGAGMLAVDPQQPTQPRLVPPATVEAEILASIDDLVPLLSGPPFLHTDPDLDRALRVNYLQGALDGGYLGASAVLALAWGKGRELYDGAHVPYVRRSSALKYGGLAAVIGGAVMLALRGGDPDVAVDRSGPTPLRIDVGPGHAFVSAAVSF